MARLQSEKYEADAEELVGRREEALDRRRQADARPMAAAVVPGGLSGPHLSYTAVAVKATPIDLRSNYGVTAVEYGGGGGFIDISFTPPEIPQGFTSFIVLPFVQVGGAAMWASINSFGSTSPIQVQLNNKDGYVAANGTYWEIYIRLDFYFY